MDEAAIRAIFQQELRKMGADAYQTKLDPAYPGGNPKTDDTLSGTAGSETSYPLMCLTYRYGVAGEPVIMLPFGGGKVAAGLMEPLHDGLPAQGAYWFLPSMRPETETTLTTQSRAMRLPMLFPLKVSVAQIEVTTLQAASAATIKIYSSSNGTTPIWTSNAIDTTGTGFRSSTATSPGVWLNPGYFYIVEYINSVAGVVVRAHALSASADNFLNNTTAQIAASAAAIISNTPANVIEFPFIKLT